MTKNPVNILDSTIKVQPKVHKHLFDKIVNIKDGFSGNSPPSVFIGSGLKYPKVNVGILAPPEIREDSWIYDAQNYWVKQKYGIQDILEFRSSLINSRFSSSVKNLSDKMTNIAQEVAMAAKPVDLEFSLKKKITFSMDISKYNLPMGPHAPLEKVNITSNPKVEPKVEKAISDTDFKAIDAVNYLYESNFDEQTISKLFSVGLLGIKNNRRLVSTRWSITAVDDTLGKSMLDEIKTCNNIDSYQLFYGMSLGNYYFIMLFPKNFSYELFEMYLPGSAWNPNSEIAASTDHEDFFGRTAYASNTVGGYYAARLGIIEYLHKIKKQASVLAIRLETPEYWASLGVWVVRSAARNTMNSNPIIFEDKEKMLEFVRLSVKKRFHYDLSSIYAKSVMINQILKQKNISDFI
jgi:DNA repair protein NreA